MSDMTDDLATLSDDYVLGLLSPTEAILIEELMQRDAEVATHVGNLRDQLLPLDLSAPEQDLPAGLSNKIRRRLAAQPSEIAKSVPIQIAANDPRPPSRLWPALIAATVVGIALGFGAGWQRPLPTPQVVAVLLDADGVPQAVIDDYGNDTAQVRFVADVAVPADRALQAWTLPSADMGATSLGVLDRAAPKLLKFQDLPDPNALQLYEVTLEPLGGSPTGRPTGPIVGKGYAAVQG